MPIIGGRQVGVRGLGFQGAGKPNAPTSVTATDVGTGRAYNNGAATVSFTPGSDNGAPVSTYTVTSSPGGYTNTGSSSPITVTGLQSNTAYTFTVTATNAVGTSDAGTSNSITATTVPQAPTIGTATSVSGTSATVTYTANATGGKTVTVYTATSSPGSVSGTGASPITVSGLTNGTAYTFTVTATNANGTSAASAVSNSITTARVLSSWTASTNYPTIVANPGTASVSSGPLFVAGWNSVTPFTYYTATYSWTGSSWTSRGNTTNTVESAAGIQTSTTEAQIAGGTSNAGERSDTYYFNGSSLSAATNISGSRYQLFATSLGGNTFIIGAGTNSSTGNSNATSYRTGTGAFSTGPVWPFSGQAWGFTNGNFSRAYTMRHNYTNFPVYYTTALNGAWTTSFNWPAWTSDRSVTVNGDALVTEYFTNNIYRMTDAGVFTSIGTFSAGANRNYGIASNGAQSGTQLSVVGGYNGTTGVNNHYTATYN